jgi:hypothetical protein
LGATVWNLVSMATWQPEFCTPAQHCYDPHTMHNFRLPPQCIWDFCSSGMLTQCRLVVHNNNNQSTLCTIAEERTSVPYTNRHTHLPLYCHCHLHMCTAPSALHHNSLLLPMFCIFF